MKEYPEMCRPKKLLEGEELHRYAKELGVSDHGACNGRTMDAELQSRVMEAERHRRDAKLWIVALVSAIASMVSAIAAWYAVLNIKP